MGPCHLTLSTSLPKEKGGDDYVCRFHTKPLEKGLVGFARQRWGGGDEDEERYGEGEGGGEEEAGGGEEGLEEDGAEDLHDEVGADLHDEVDDIHCLAVCISAESKAFCWVHNIYYKMWYNVVLIFKI